MLTFSIILLYISYISLKLSDLFPLFLSVGILYFIIVSMIRISICEDFCENLRKDLTWQLRERSEYDEKLGTLKIAEEKVYVPFASDAVKSKTNNILINAILDSRFSKLLKILIIISSLSFLIPPPGYVSAGLIAYWGATNITLQQSIEKISKAFVIKIEKSLAN